MHSRCLLAILIIKYEDYQEKDEKCFTKVQTDHQASYSIRVSQNVC